MDRLARIETFLFRALWIIMWLIYKRGGDRTDEQRMHNWRADYYRAGGNEIEPDPDHPDKES